MSLILLDDGELSYTNPLGAAKSKELEELLRSRSCIHASFVGADQYAIGTYIVQSAYSQTDCVFLFDRNIYSQVIALSKGARVTESSRCAAALMAFASIANINIEPNIALYEGAQSGARKAWKMDLALFHAADKIHPTNWAGLALEIFDQFDLRIRTKRGKRGIENPFEPKMKLKHFGFVYPSVLKLALIYRRGGNKNAAMVEFLDWVYKSWLFSFPSICLASLVLGRNPPRRAFKGIGGKNRAAALKGVKNAAWDLVYATEWFKLIQRQKKTNTLVSICTQDACLGRVSDLIVRACFSEHEGEKQILTNAGFDQGVTEHYLLLMSQLKNERRAMHLESADRDSQHEKLVKELEAEIFS